MIIHSSAGLEIHSDTLIFTIDIDYLRNRTTAYITLLYACSIIILCQLYGTIFKK
jgi:hypothetical protein